ncbi:nitroreductase family deazaflavin-dependent oxidoreductase [Nocardia sp. NPDC003693]
MTTFDRGPSMFPAWFDRLQVKYMNPAMRRVAPYLPGFAVIEHRGRKSGRAYTTPVNAFTARGTFAVVLGHGITDWARNVVAAGDTTVRSRFRTVRLANARIVAPGQAGADVPRAARLAGGKFNIFLADIV